MKKNLILFFLLIIAFKGYSQSNFNSSKFASTFIECFYILKTSSSIPFSQDCQDAMKQKMFDIDIYLQTQLKENRAAMLAKLGAADLQELEGQLKNYEQYSTMSETSITANQRQSMVLWVSLSKTTVERIFIKLKKV